MTIFMFKKEMFYHLMEIYDHLFCMRNAHCFEVLYIVKQKLTESTQNFFQI